MKQPNLRPAILMPILLIFLICFITPNLYASNNHKEYEFKILIEKTMEGKIFLTCIDGCEWDNLEYNESNEPKVINQEGFTSEDNKDESDFLISITPIRHGMVIEGLKGTRWRELTFSCIVVDQCFAGFSHMGTASIAPD